MELQTLRTITERRVKLLCYVQFNLKKEDAPLLTNYLYVWTFAFCLLQYKRKNKKGVSTNSADVHESCVVCFCAAVSITISVSFFLVVVFLVSHVSYYITVYLIDVKSCIWFG